MMTETKTEIVVIATLAAAGFVLWWHNHSRGAGTGLEGVPLLGTAAQAAASALPTITLAGGAPIVYNAPTNPTAGGCNCASSPVSGQVFGSAADLANFLLANPAIAALPGLSIATSYT